LRAVTSGLSPITSGLSAITLLGTVPGLGAAQVSDWLCRSVSDCFEVESRGVQTQILEEKFWMRSEFRLPEFDGSYDVLEISWGLLQARPKLLNLLALLGHSLLLFLGWNVARFQELEGELRIALGRAECGLAVGPREHRNLA
jgi:hypothetical protein